MAQLSGQLVHHFLEDHRVYILAKHVEQEPVADVRLFNNSIDDFTADKSEANVEEVGAHLGTEHDDEPVQDHKQGQHRKENKPEIEIQPLKLINF